MTRFAAILTAVAAVALSATGVFAQDKAPAAKPAMEKLANAAKGGKAICPITKEEFTVTPASDRSTYKGKTYAFCCGGCKPQFDKNPTKFVTEAKPAVKSAKPVAKKKQG